MPNASSRLLLQTGEERFGANDSFPDEHSSYTHLVPIQAPANRPETTLHLQRYHLKPESHKYECGPDAQDKSMWLAKDLELIYYYNNKINAKTCKPPRTATPTLTAAQIPFKWLRAKRATTHCDPTLTAAQIRVKCLRAKRATTRCEPTLTAAQILHKCPRAKRVTTHCDPTLTAAQIPHKYLRAKRANTYCDPTLTAAQIHNKCPRAK